MKDPRTSTSSAASAASPLPHSGQDSGQPPAGKRRGAADDRAIWPEMFRVIKEARPAWIIAENVAGFVTMEQFDVLLEMERDGSAKGELGTVVNRVGRGIADEAVEALESIGYAVAPFVVPACAVDARHRRDRLWIIGRNVAEAEHDGLHDTKSRSGTQRAAEGTNELQQSAGQNSICHAAEQGLPNGRSTPMGNARGTEPESQRSDCDGGCRWLPEPDVGRVAHGISSRVDRLKGLGNSIVPQVAYEILREIRKLI